MEPPRKRRRPDPDQQGTDSQYVHEPLQPDSERIRKLKLLPASSSASPLRGDLVIDSLERKEYEYEALSYTWGSNEKPCFILINGRPLHIGRNLDNALRALRQKDCHRWLWVDAICINQKNDIEKTNQVLLMAVIYMRGQSTISWLGSDSDECDALATMGFFDWLAKSERVKKSLGDNGNLSKLEQAFRKYNRESTVPSAHITQAKLAQFCQRPYFTRRWVLQEVGSAESVQFMCDHTTISGSALASGASSLLFKDSPIPITTPFMRLMSLQKPEKYHASAKKRAGRSDEEQSSDSYFQAIGALERFRDFECSDGRDRIASLVWVAGVNPLLAVNYEKSVEDVYTSFIFQLCSECLVLALSSAARRRHEASNTLPSWVPDWRVSGVKEEVVELQIASKVAHSGNHVCLLRQKIESSFHMEIARDLSILNLSLESFQQNETLFNADHGSVLQNGDVIIQFSEDNHSRFDLAGKVRAIVLRSSDTSPERWKLVGALDLTVKGRVSNLGDWTNRSLTIE